MCILSLLEHENVLLFIDLKPAKKDRPLRLIIIVQEKLNNGPRVGPQLKKSDMLYILKYIPPVHECSQLEEDSVPLDDEANDEVEQSVIEGIYVFR